MSKRAIKMAVRLLEQDGHHVEHYVPFDFLRAFKLYLDHMLADDGINAMATLEHDIIDPNLLHNIIAWKSPRWFRRSIIYRLVYIADSSNCLWISERSRAVQAICRYP